MMFSAEQRERTFAKYAAIAQRRLRILTSGSLSDAAFTGYEQQRNLCSYEWLEVSSVLSGLHYNTYRTDDDFSADRQLKRGWSGSFRCLRESYTASEASSLGLN